MKVLSCALTLAASTPVDVRTAADVSGNVDICLLTAEWLLNRSRRQQRVGLRAR